MTKKTTQSVGTTLLGILPEVLSIIKVEKELEAVYCSRPGFVGADFFLEHAEKIDAFNIVSWLCGDEADLEKANEWLEENRDTLTTAKLSNIILEAMLQGDSYFMRRRANIRHADTPATDSRILELWSFYQAKGLSKGNAAPRIAKEVELAESTIRKKLQGK